MSRSGSADGAGSRRGVQMLEGDVRRVLVELTVPVTLGLASTFLFGVVDAYFVGRLGSRELGALGFTFPLTLVLNNVAAAVGVAATSVVARTVGEGDTGRVREATHHTMWISAGLGVLLAGMGMVTLSAFIRLLGVTADVKPLVREYMTIWYAGLPLLLVPMVGSSVLRAMGDARTPSAVQVASMVLNGGLDPLLIFGLGAVPRLGLAGAAWASVLSRAATLVAYVYVLGWRERVLEPSVPRLRVLLESIRPLFSIGLPTIVTRLASPVSMILITRLAASYGSETVAALGVGGRVENLVTMVLGSLAIALISFVGQNWGARRWERVLRGVRVSMVFSLVWGAGMCVLLLLAAPWVAARFSANARVVEATTSYLRMLSLGVGFQGISMLMSAAFNAANRPLHSTAITLVRVFALYVPLAYFGSRLWGRDGVFIGGCAATVLAGAGALAWGERFFRREVRSADASVGMSVGQATPPG